MTEINANSDEQHLGQQELHVVTSKPPPASAFNGFNWLSFKEREHTGSWENVLEEHILQSDLEPPRPQPPRFKFPVFLFTADPRRLKIWDGGGWSPKKDSMTLSEIQAQGEIQVLPRRGKVVRRQSSTFPWGQSLLHGQHSLGLQQPRCSVAIRDAAHQE